MKFYRDVLDGPLYFIVLVVSVILIMAIIGFIMERKKFATDAKNKVAHVDKDVTPIEEVKVEEKTQPTDEQEEPKKEEKKIKPKEVINFTPEPEEQKQTSDEGIVSVNTEVPVFEEVGNSEIKVEDNK